MKPTKDYIARAYDCECYVDRSDGTIYHATPRATFLNAVNELIITRQEQLNYCNAKICYCYYSEFFKCNPILLLSYGTYVAVYIPTTDRLFVFDYYSPTTSQHLAKFRVWLRNHYYRVLNFPIYRRVRDKKGSHIEYEPFIPFVNK
uniref:DUF8033 domain-containing protein n=1 Tax=Podoviridae sp. ctfAL26 TaxID=2825265 RepID=A0A8S5PF56_9CAUD|nr:MAG TPA: hypothetical protein [Podoviridae sp. ctfAL26]